MIALRQILDRLGLQQRALAEHLDLSRAAVAQWLNHDQWPTRVDSAQLRRHVGDWLRAHGATPADLADWWRAVPADQAAALIRPGRGRGKRAGVRDITAVPPTDRQPEDKTMLLRGTKLTEDTRKRFSLFRDPFRAEIEKHSDLYITPDMRYCREGMWQTALHGGMTAIVGESGSGKTTLREDLAERIKTAAEPVILIQPYVIDMEERGGRRRTLGARDIAASIVNALAPHDPIRQDSQARFLQVHRLLAASAKLKNKHCLVIEEAHDLPTSTLRHLKRYLELKDGFTPLLSIVLLGQPELGYRLSELDASIREIVQRCEVLTLEPLGAHLGPYVRHKLAAVGADWDAIFEPDAIDAIAKRLTAEPARGSSVAATSLVYPLAVNNLVTAAINLAAELGMPNAARPRISGDLVREV